MDRTPVALRIVTDAEVERDPGQALSLEAAFRRYGPYVAAISLRLMGRDDEVDDVVQDVFLSAIKGFGQVRDPGAIKGWLATVAVRVARRRLRLRKLRSFLGVEDVAGHEALTAPGANPEQKALLGRVYRVLDGLPVNERIAWVLRHIEGEQLEDVAELCGCSLATAKRRIAAAQQEIERALSDG